MIQLSKKEKKGEKCGGAEPLVWKLLQSVRFKRTIEPQITVKEGAMWWPENKMS